jgi:hypothetical protein
LVRKADERAVIRADRLASLINTEDRRNIDKIARDERRKLWTPHHSDVIRLRPGLVVGDDQESSPIREIEAGKSAAVQLLLLSIFEVQCRAPGHASRPTTVPLRDPTDANETAWRYLVALPTTDQRTRRTLARTPTDNRVDQIKNALTRLEDCGRVELKPKGTRNRYEHFRLLNESADNSSSLIYYKVPRSNEHTINVPAAFFLNGWVHALTDSEIITYLFMLLLAQLQPDKNAGEGMEIPAKTWAHAFGKRGRGYEAYRFLYRYGLIQITRDPRRRADGTVEDGGQLDEHGNKNTGTDPHRFSVNPAALERDGLPIVVRGLKRFSEGLDYELANWTCDGDQLLAGTLMPARAPR